MIRPERRSSMSGGTACTAWKTPNRLVATTFSNRAGSSSSIRALSRIPALATRTSTGPSSERARATRSRSCCGSRTSARTATHRAPSTSTSRRVSSRSSGVDDG